MTIAAQLDAYHRNRLLQFVRPIRFRTGPGAECRICLATDHTGLLTHLPWCQSIRDQIRHQAGETP